MKNYFLGFAPAVSFLVLVIMLSMAGCFLPPGDGSDTHPSTIDLGYAIDYEITGTLKNSAGKPLPDMLLYFWTDDENFVNDDGIMWFSTDENGTYQITGVPDWNTPDCPSLDIRFNGTKDADGAEKNYEQVWYRNIEARVSNFPVSEKAMTVDISAVSVDDNISLQFTIDTSLDINDIVVEITGKDAEGRSCHLLSVWFNDQPGLSYDSSTGVYTVDKNLAGSSKSDYEELVVMYDNYSTQKQFLFGSTTIDTGTNDLGILPDRS